MCFGNPSQSLAIARGGTKGAKSKLDANMLDALWDRIQAGNRAAGSWGVARPLLTKFIK